MTVIERRADKKGITAPGQLPTHYVRFFLVLSASFSGLSYSRFHLQADFVLNLSGGKYMGGSWEHSLSRRCGILSKHLVRFHQDFIDLVLT